MGNISKDVQTAGTLKVRNAETGPVAGDAPTGHRRYVTSAGKFHAIVIHPKKNSAMDAEMCRSAKQATGGLPIQFIDWVYVTDDPAIIRFLDSRIAEGLLPSVAEDASADVAAILAEAGIEMDGGRAVRRKKSE